MEKLINPYDKEHMRLAMLKHEEVFREQVLELHRLYQAQKMLMKNIQRSKQTNQEQPTWNFKICEEKIQGLDLERPSMEESNKNAKTVDESELLELTLGPSKSFYRRRKVANAPLSLSQSDNYSVTSLSSSSSNNKQHHHQLKMNTSRQVNNNQKSRVDNREASNVASEENLRQNISLNNSPNWLFQVLSLKMT